MFCNIPKRGIRYRYILVLSAVTQKKNDMTKVQKQVKAAVYVHLK